MAICTFYQRGNCRHGNNCRFEHVDSNSQSRDSRPPPNNNRFSTLQPQGQGRDAPAKPPYSLTRDGIIADLQTERPQWILSAYGPGLHAPAQLWGGEAREQSFEEMRLLQYLGAAQGNPQAPAQQADNLIREAEAQIQNALQDVDGAMRYVMNAENEHPNRLDICKQGTVSGAINGTLSSSGGSSNAAAPLNPFGGAAQAAHSPFGQPSTLGRPQNPFGQQSQPSPNPFGTPTVGQKPNPFGGTSQAPPFGQPSALGLKSSPFGTQSNNVPSGGSFAAHRTTPNPFSTQPQIQGPSSISNPNPFGTTPQAVQAANPIGVTSPSTEPFGAPSPAATNPFAQTSVRDNPFGLRAPVKETPFSVTSQSAPVNPFTTQQAPINPFSTTSTQAPSANLFANTPAPQNPFGSNSEAQPPPTTSQHPPFGRQPFLTQPSPSGHQPPQTLISSSRGNPSSGYRPLPLVQQGQGITGLKSPYAPTSQIQHPFLSTYSTIQADGRITMFRGKQVTYPYKDGSPAVRNRDGGIEKIWFPDGPPAWNGDTEIPEELGKLDEDMKRIYESARETGVFEGGKIPLLPPKREWCVWDF